MATSTPMPSPRASVARGSAIGTPCSTSSATMTSAVAPERTATAAGTLAP